MNQFNWATFRTYYLQTSKYANKQNLASAFYNVWANYMGVSNGLNQFLPMSYYKSIFTAKAKKEMKMKLLGYGYTSAGIDGIFKAFTKWVSVS